MPEKITGWKNWFVFSKRERIAAWILFLLLIVVCILIVFRERKSHDKNYNVSMFDSLVGVLTDTETSDNTRSPSFQPERKNIVFQDSHNGIVDTESVCHDPNRMQFGDWYALGLPFSLIRTLLNYRSAGGYFYVREDLKKVYGMTDSIYDAISTWLEVPDSMPVVSGVIADRMPSGFVTVKLNQADSVTLLTLPGIGPVLAGRILRYRDLLGGFVIKDQLTEVYGLSEQTFHRIEPLLVIDSSRIIQINLNRSSFAELVRHPYISVYTANAILAYRNFKGNIDSLEELTGEKLITGNNFIRLRPYLRVR
ncbi:MAG: helix-hairpin-helix domain-containing protein [Chlorobi bacterium]|nr:helix-hairpin-helix domain-containing protein [Chlorobiota bacterium]